MFESEDRYALLLEEKDGPMQFEFEVIRLKETDGFDYYAVATLISGDLLTFKGLMMEAK